MADQSTMQEVVGWLKDFLQWAKDTLTDDAARRALREDLGLDPDQTPPATDIPQDKLDSIDRYRKAADPDKDALLGAFADIRVLFDAGRGLIGTIGDGVGATVPELVHRLWGLLAINYIRLRYPRTYVVAQLFGFLEETVAPRESGQIYFDRIPDLFKGFWNYLKEHWKFPPEDEEQAQFMSNAFFPLLSALFAFGLKQPKLLYGWDPGPFSTMPRADMLSRRMASYSLVSTDTDLATGKEIEKALNFTLAFVTRQHGGPGLFIALGGGGEAEVSAGDRWRAVLKLNSSVAVDLFIKEGWDVSFHSLTGTPTDIRFSAGVESVPRESGATYSFPSKSETRIDIGRLSFVMSFSPAEALVKAAAEDCALVLHSKDNDSFISSLLPDDEMRVPFNFGVGVSSERGLFTEGNIPWLSGHSTKSSDSQPAPQRALARTMSFAGPGATTPDSSPVQVGGSGSASNGFNLVIPIARSLGPVTFDQLILKLVPDTDAKPKKVATTIAVAIRAQLGPVFVSIDQLGFQLNLAFPDTGGNLGFADLSLGVRTPTAVGVSIDSAAVSGGGYLGFDPQKEEYSGMLELQIAETISVKAIGLLTTRMPDGGKGYSLVVIIFVEGFAPIQLGFGFALTGIGGLLGINRTFNEETLRSGLKNHTLDSVMFPQDPIRNAPQIISNLNKVFPPANGHHLFGPMAQIAWGTPPLITANLGVVLEFGARLRLLILAQIVAILPKRENDLVRLQMDAIGVIDFDQGTAALDASLYDSRLLKKFVLTGDIAMRLKWEDSPHFALAVGGLHPAFNPPPAFPKLERIALNLSAGDNPRLRCEAYFALTSNTLQFGARAELYASASGFSIQGETGFDVLIQLDPFYFVADFYAQLQLKRGSTNLFKVRVEGALAGPRPLHIKAKATFEILWMDVSFRFDKTLVEGEKPPPPEPVDVLPQLKEALSNPGNWTGRLPAGQRPMVTLRATPGPATDVLLHPLGTLAVKQSVVPLNMDISRFGQAAPAGARRFTISSVSLDGQDQTTHSVTDFFAPAQFFEMSDDEKLARPSFEPLAAGVSIGSDEFFFTDNTDDWLEVQAIEFETITVDKEKNESRRSGPEDLYKLSPKLLGKQARFGAAGASDLRRTGKAKYRTRTGKYQVAKEGWSIVVTDDLSVQPAPGIEAGKLASYSEAAQALRKMEQENPTKAAGLKILRLSEVRAIQ